MKLIAELDGNALCIKNDDFINLQESPAFFIELSEELLEDFNSFLKEIKEQPNTITNGGTENESTKQKI